jgi:hypothetical protein
VSSQGPFLETLRSAGAPVVLLIDVYKHLAPLEPEHYFFSALAALCTSVANCQVECPGATRYRRWY